MPGVLMLTVRWYYALTSMLMAGCTFPQASDKDKETTAASAKVRLTKPERKTLHRSLEQPGQIEAYEETALFARVPGYVDRMNVDAGDPIRGPRLDKKGQPTEAGQVLAVLSVPELE